MSPTNRCHSTSPPPAPRAKRNRLNVACNYCRSRKTRCDAQQPQCRACRIAGIPCVTVDRRQPDAPVQRQAAGRRSTAPNTSESEPVIEQHEQQPQTGVSATEEPTPSASSADAVSRFQGRLTIFQPRQHHARTLDSVENIVNWLNVALYRLGSSSGAALSAYAAAELPHRIPLCPSTAPQLPSREACDHLVASFFTTVNLVYPVVHKRTFSDALIFAQTYGLERFAERYGLALMMQIYLVLLLAATSQPDVLQPSYMDELKDYCKTLQGHVLAYNNLDAIRAATLMTLQYICQGQETAAWAMLIQSCVMATSMGLNTASRSQSMELGSRQLVNLNNGERVWWSLYCLEKLFAFELGRSSNILEPGKDQPRISTSFAEAQTQEDTAFVIMTSLARTLHEISIACIRVGEREDNSHDAEALRAAISAKVRTTGECGMLLYDWAGNLPAAYRPTSELLYVEKIYSIGAFVSMQYHHALLMLCRNSLLLTEEAIKEATEVMAKDQPWEHFVRHGQTIAANAARKILTLTIEGADHHERTAMPTLAISLHAAFVLHVHGIRHSRARMISIDQTLVSNALQQIEEMLDYPRDHSSMRSIVNAFRNIYQRPSNMQSAGMNATPDGIRVGQDGASIIPHDLTAGSIGIVNQVPANDGFVSVNRTPLSRHQVWGGGELHATINDEFLLDDFTLPSAFADQIGWDWSAFSQLLSLPGSPRNG